MLHPFSVPMHNKIYKTIKEYTVMAFALSLYAFSWTAFLIPNEITAGGVTGLSSILNYAFGIPISYSYLVYSYSKNSLYTFSVANCNSNSRLYIVGW